MSEPQRAGRRRALAWVAGALATGLGLALAVPAAAFLTFPTRRRTVAGAEGPIDVASLAALPEGVPVKVPVRVRRWRDAWAVFTDVVLGGAWLVRRGDQVTAWSTVCPHAGCAVDWDPARACFACPCHDSRFGLDGARQAGPAPRGLDPLAARVQDGRVSLTWRRFRAGVTGREPT